MVLESIGIISLLKQFGKFFIHNNVYIAFNIN